MRVLVVGATGYIGSAICGALAAADHTPIGLARSEAAVEKLADRGVPAVRGDLADSQGLAKAALATDGVIFVASNSSDPDGSLTSAAVRDTLLAFQGTERAVVITNGGATYGDTSGQVIDEDAPAPSLPELRWRIELENDVLGADGSTARGVVVRPTKVYGYGAGLIGQLVASARRYGAARIVGHGDNYWSLVHLDDLADLYVRAVTRAPAGTRVVGASSWERYRDLATAASQAAGCEGRVEEWREDDPEAPRGPHRFAVTLDQRITSQRARTLLGWDPHAPSVYEEIQRGSYAAT